MIEVFHRRPIRSMNQNRYSGSSSLVGDRSGVRRPESGYGSVGSVTASTIKRERIIRVFPLCEDFCTVGSHRGASAERILVLSVYADYCTPFT
jgi:hypothetical protein